MPTCKIPPIYYRNLSVSSRIDHDSLSGDGFEKVGIADGFGLDRVDVADEQILEREQKAEVGPRTFAGCDLLKFDQKIEVACCRTESLTNRRAEQLEAMDMKAPAHVMELGPL
jgi:hypothetical protein